MRRCNGVPVVAERRWLGYGWEMPFGKHRAAAVALAGLCGLLLQACPWGEPPCEPEAGLFATVSDEAGNPVRVEPDFADPTGRIWRRCNTGFGGFSCLVIDRGTHSVSFERGGVRYERSAEFDRLTCDEGPPPSVDVEFVVPAYDPASGEPCPSDTVVPVAKLVSPFPVVAYLQGIGYEAFREAEVGPVEVTLLGEHGLSGSKPIVVRGQMRLLDPSWCNEERPSSTLTAKFEVTFAPQPAAAACAYEVVRVPVRQQDIYECVHVVGPG